MKFAEYFIGKSIDRIDGGESGSDSVTFFFTDGTAVVSYHSQDCCESVSIERVDGDIAALIGQSILEASGEYGDDPAPPHADSYTWTHHKLRTSAGEVDFVWLGESNGYYGETPYTRITHGAKV